MRAGRGPWQKKGDVASGIPQSAPGSRLTRQSRLVPFRQAPPWGQGTKREARRHRQADGPGRCGHAATGCY